MAHRKPYGNQAGSAVYRGILSHATHRVIIEHQAGWCKRHTRGCCIINLTKFEAQIGMVWHESYIRDIIAGKTRDKD